MNDKIRSKLTHVRTPWHRSAVGFLLSALIVLGRVRATIRTITPRRAIIPVALLHTCVAALSLLIGEARGAIAFAVCSLVIVGMVLLPATREADTYHWISPQGIVLEKKKK